MKRFVGLRKHFEAVTFFDIFIKSIYGENNQQN